MRILLIPMGSAGDVHPFVGIGTALQRRGHKVSIIVNPYFGLLANEAGLKVLPFGTTERFNSLIGHPNLWNQTKGIRVIAEVLKETTPELYRIIVSEIKQGPLVIVAHSLAFAARYIQDQLGTPLITLHLQPVNIQSMYDSPVLHPWLSSVNQLPVPFKRFLFWIGNREADRVFGPSVNELYRRESLPPVRNIMSHWLHSPQRIIGLFPEWYAPPQPDWPSQSRLTGFPLFDADFGTTTTTEVERFLKAGSPPIVFVPGSANQQAESFFIAATDACKKLRRRGVFLTRYPHQVPRDLPSEICSFDYVPLSQILPRALALVHHGGIGTAAQGLAAGLPQLVMPMTFDQPDNASRLENLGVARTVWPRSFRGSVVAAELDKLLKSETVTSRCREFAQNIRDTKPVKQTCELIEELENRAS